MHPISDTDDHLVALVRILARQAASEALNARRTDHTRANMAAQRVLERDSQPLQDETEERAVAHRLAIYLELEHFSDGWHAPLRLTVSTSRRRPARIH